MLFQEIHKENEVNSQSLAFLAVWQDIAQTMSDNLNISYMCTYKNGVFSDLLT